MKVSDGQSAHAVTASDRSAEEQPCRSVSEQMELICKLRWMGMEKEAGELQQQMRDVMPGGGVLTAPRDTD